MATRYVDSGVAGPGAGTIGDPWGPTINNILSNLVAGDILLVRGGPNKVGKQSYTETLAITNANGCANGTAVNPITIRNFAGEYSTFDQAASADTFEIDREYWVIDGTATDGGGDYFFELDKGTYNGDNGFNIDADHNTVRYVEMHGSEEFMVDIDGDYNTIEYCQIYDLNNGPNKDTHGVFLRGSSSYNVIDHCEIYDCRGDCVQLFDDAGAKVANEISYCDMYANIAVAAGCENAIDDKDGEGTLIHQ